MRGPMRIEVDSPAHDMLRLMMARTPARDISIVVHNARLQFKWGGGTWTTPLSTSAPREDRSKPCGDPDCGCS